MKELRSLIHNQSQKMNEFQKEIADQKFIVNEMKQEINLLKVKLSVPVCTHS